MRLHVLTSDKYIKAVRPFYYLLNKYWPGHPDAVVVGFTAPDFWMPPGFSFYSVGQFKDYPVTRWSDALIKYLREIPDEIVCLFLEDMWLIRPVNIRLVQMCYDYMKQFEYVARLDLTGDRLHAGGASLYGKLGEYDLIWSDPNSPYHLSLMPALWRKSHLLRVIAPGETPWDVEINGTPRLSALKHEVIVLGTNGWPIRNTLAFRGGDVSKLLLDELTEEDRVELKSYGLLEGLTT